MTQKIEITSAVLCKTFKSMKGYKIALTHYQKSVQHELDYVEESIRHQKSRKIFPILYMGESALQRRLELYSELRKIQNEKKAIANKN